MSEGWWQGRWSYSAPHRPRGLSLGALPDLCLEYRLPECAERFVDTQHTCGREPRAPTHVPSATCSLPESSLRTGLWVCLLPAASSVTSMVPGRQWVLSAYLRSDM